MSHKEKRSRVSAVAFSFDGHECGGEGRFAYESGLRVLDVCRAPKIYIFSTVFTIPFSSTFSLSRFKACREV